MRATVLELNDYDAGLALVDFLINKLNQRLAEMLLDL